MPGPADPYAVLGVEPGASDADLKAAWRRLAREWHPDRNPSPEAGRRFAEIADAWAILSDPQKRSRVDRRRTRVRQGDLPEPFLMDVVDAVERAEAWIVGAVLPHYVRYGRGHGAELAARIWRDLDDLARPRSLERAAFAGRRVHRWFGRIEVTLIVDPAPHPTVLLRHGDFWEVGVTPYVLWHAGVRDSAAIDDVVLRSLLLRFAQIAAHGRFVPGERTTDDHVAEARQRDSQAVRWRALRLAGWTVLAIILGVMFVAGARGW